MGRSLRILVVTPDFPPAAGGIQVLAHRLVAHLPDTMRVITIDMPGADAVDRGLGADVHRISLIVPGPRAVGLAALSSVAITHAFRFRPDVVLNLHVITSPGAIAISRLLDVPYVQYVYAEEVLDRPWLTRLALRRASAVVILSEFGRDLALAHGAAPERLHRILCGVDPPPPAIDARSPEPTIVTVSRIAERYKGHDVMLQALPLILSRVPSARWIVIGDGPLLAEHKRVATETGLADRVTFLGLIEDSERDAWLDRAHVFVMVSRLSDRGGGEGFGIIFLEAGAHGLPVVAGAVGGALDAVQHDITGLLVDPNDSGAVADAVAGLLLDPARAEALGQAGRRRAEALSWASTASAVHELLESVVQERASAV